MKLFEIANAVEHYTFYHGTKNHEAIKSNRFKIIGSGGNRNSSGPYGDGIYLAPEKTLAKSYGTVLTVEADLNLKHMTSVQWNTEMSSDKFQTWFKTQTGTPEHLMSEWFHKQGFDGIFIKIGSGLDQAIVYTPEKLKIISST